MYVTFDANTGAGVSELQGLRQSLEDSFAIGEVFNFEKLSEDDRKTALLNQIKFLQKQVVENQYLGGSTLCSVVLHQNKIYTSSVGDSLAFLIILDSNGHVIEFKRLNKYLHNPIEQHENERLKNGGYDRYISGSRLGGMLALSRAMGDNRFEQFGLLHEPDDIFIDTVITPLGGKAFVMLACDGLTESDCLVDEKIKALFETYHNLSPDKLADKLTQSALDAGSTDNVSVIINTLNPISNKTIYMAIFDGHGGAEVAELLSHQFDYALKNEIALLLQSC